MNLINDVFGPVRRDYAVGAGELAHLMVGGGGCATRTLGGAPTADAAKLTTANQTLTSDNGTAAAAAPAALQQAVPTDPTQLINLYIYTPIHTATEQWINSPGGQQFASFVNTALGSYAIGDGSAGTSA